MGVFLLYVISPAIVSFFTRLSYNNGQNREKRYRIVTLFISGFIMALMIGLRKYTNGSGDSEVYYNHWKSISRLNFFDISLAISSSNFEVGYSIFVHILSHLFPHPQFVFIISGIFISFSVCTFVGKNCKNIPLALVAFNTLELFIFMVQGLRQAMAMGICLFAIEQCKQKRLFRFLLLVILAMSFHASAIVFFICFPLLSLKLKWWHLLVFASGCVVITILLPYLWDFVGIFIRDKYEMKKDINGFVGYVPILILFVVLVTAFILKPSVVQKEYYQDYSLFFYMTAFAMLLMCVRYTIGGIAERISFFFSFGEMVLISNSIENVKERDTKLFLELCIIALCFGVAIHKATYTSLVPYDFFWQ